LQKLFDKNSIGVVVLAYNRPSHLQRLLISLEKSKITRISLYLDKPQDQTSLINQKEIIRMINAAKYWLKCKIKKQKKHQGVSKSVKLAIDNELKTYNKIIFLEDDCIPFKFFFEYMLKCLNKFENNKQIMSVCGYQLPFFKKKNNTVENIILKRFIPWGWGTWRDRWKKYNKNLKSIKKEILNSKKKVILPLEIRNYLKNKNLLDNNEDIWSINWTCVHYLNNSLCVYPDISLVRNIGFDGSGIHCDITDAFTVNNYDKNLSKVIIKNKVLEEKKLNKKIEKYLLKNFPKTIFKNLG